VTYDSSDPTTIERALAETRARLDSHLDELTSRLSPGQLLDDGLDYLRRGQGAQFVRNLGCQLRDNPLPVALVGIGLVWLMAASAWSRSSTDRTDGTRGTVGNAFDDVAARAQRAGDASEDAFDSRTAAARAGALGLRQEATETAAAFARRVRETLEGAHQSARDRLASVGQTASGWGAAVADRAQQTGAAIGQTARQSRDKAVQAGTALGETVNRHPMLLGAAGLAAGVLLAALLPATEREDALLAPADSALKSTVDRGTQAAEAASGASRAEVAGG